MEKDINAKLAELEEIVRRYRNCVAGREFALATEVLDEWRQATKTALENMYLNGYELGIEAARQVAAGK